MRIIAGAWRGRPIQAPAGQSTRPTADRAREGLFSMLASRLGSFDGLAVADLFAGSGALGLEALSRGAASCLFVETDRAAADLIRRNLQALGGGDRAEVRCQPAERLSPSRRFDLVLADPPYRSGLAEALVPRLADWLAPGGWASIESGAPLPADTPGLQRMVERRFGRATITLFSRAAEPASAVPVAP